MDENVEGLVDEERVLADCGDVFGEEGGALELLRVAGGVEVVVEQVVEGLAAVHNIGCPRGQLEAYILLLISIPHTSRSTAVLSHCYSCVWANL